MDHHTKVACPLVVGPCKFSFYVWIDLGIIALIAIPIPHKHALQYNVGFPEFKIYV